MIYNWEDENIDLFIGIGKKVRPYTDEELTKMRDEEEKDKLLEKNKKEIIQLIESFGWKYEYYFDTIMVVIEPTQDHKLSKEILIRVDKPEADQIVNSLIQIKEFTKNNPIIDRDPRYKMEGNTIRRFVTAYTLKADDKKMKNIEKKRVYRNFSIFDIDNNSEFSLLVKAEKPELYEYLKNNKNNLWQLKTATTKKERRRNEEKFQLHDEIISEVETIVSELGKSKFRY